MLYLGSQVVTATQIVVLIAFSAIYMMKQPAETLLDFIAEVGKPVLEHFLILLGAALLYHVQFIVCRPHTIENNIADICTSVICGRC